MTVSPNEYRWDFMGLSTEDKPTKATSENVTDGSTYYEVDTSKLYVFYGSEWYEKQSTGGGGGGDNDFIKLEVTVNADTQKVYLNKTAAEILAYYEADKFLGSTFLIPADTLIYAQVCYGLLVKQGDEYFLSAYTKDPTGTIAINLEAKTINSTFVGELPA